MAAISALTVAPAHAQTATDRALEYAAAADDEAALSAFDEELAREQLEVSALVLLLAERAIAFDALGQNAARDEQLRYLAALEPDFRFSLRARPMLVARWLHTRAITPALALRVGTSRSRLGLMIHVSADAEAVLPGLRYRIAYRLGGDGWTFEERSQIFVRAEAESVEYYVEAIGLGHVVLARQGRGDAPLRDESPTRGTPQDSHPELERVHTRRRWIAGLTVALAAASAVVLAASLSGRGADDSERTPKPQP